MILMFLGKRFIISLEGMCYSEGQICISLCLIRNDTYHTGVPVDDKGRRRMIFNLHVEMNVFDIDVEPLNFENSHTDKGVPCKHSKAEDIPASISVILIGT